MDIETNKHLHIISFDIPFPANYGGVIDVYYKILALYKIGVKVHLHAFEYGRKHAKELDEICFSVNYYKRPEGFLKLLNIKPYIVNSRDIKSLLNNLLLDSYPILFEGLHTTALLADKALKTRIKLVRPHNIEHHYYWQLSKASSSYYKKLFFALEVPKLKKFESSLSFANHILAISANDEIYFKNKYKHVQLLPVFHSANKVNSIIGSGSYILYHGNLSVEENEKVALFLIKSVFSKFPIKAIITGKNPTAAITEAAKAYEHIHIIGNPSDVKMNDLIQNAHIHTIPTFQDTGIKLKLLKSISEGRHCLVNSLMVKNTGLESLCHISEDAQSMIHAINELMETPFTRIDIEQRKEIIEKMFSNEKGARIIAGLIS